MQRLTTELVKLVCVQRLATELLKKVDVQRLTTELVTLICVILGPNISQLKLVN